MLLKSLQLTLRNFRGITRAVNTETYLNIQSQSYARWASRIPSAIVNEDELFDIEVADTITKKPKVGKKVKSTSPKLKKSANIVKKNIKERTEKEFSETEDEVQNDFERPSLNSTKVHLNEKKFQSKIMNLKSRKQREKNDQILLEGIRLIGDAIQAGVVAETIIYSNLESLDKLPKLSDKTELCKVPYRSIQLWSSLTTSPGIMGIFKKPEPMKVSLFSLPITIVCDQVRDPSNMGSILRAAAGAGCEKLLLTKGCVDLWSPKVLQTAVGAHFRIPIYTSQAWDDIRSHIKEDAQVYMADNNAQSQTEEFHEKKIIEEINENTNIKDIEKDTEGYIDREDEEHGQVARKTSSRLPYNKVKEYYMQFKMNEIPAIPYFSVDYTKNEVVIIIGGETEGLSEESFALIQDRQGVRVNIPLDNGVNSLNSSMALGIILFEVKKQFLNVHSRLNKLISQ